MAKITNYYTVSVEVVEDEVGYTQPLPGEDLVRILNEVVDAAYQADGIPSPFTFKTVEVVK
jgi:hypothetical protein